MIIMIIVVVVTGTRPAGDLNWPASWIGIGNLVHQHHHKLAGLWTWDENACTLFSWCILMMLLPLETRANIFTILPLLEARQTISLLHFHDLAISRNQTNLLLKTQAHILILIKKIYVDFFFY